MAALENLHELEVSDSFLVQEILEGSILGHLEEMYFILLKTFFSHTIYSD